MPAAHAQTRLKDIAAVQGVRGNQLVGYGLVVGLDGTGDGTGATFTPQSVASMLQKFGVTVPPGALKLKNVAAVMVTATLPPFVKNGSAIDVTVSSLGDAKSLQGGTLLQTPLQAANNQVYAVAQGALSVGGFLAGGGAGGSVSKNFVTVGRIPGGALVEQDVPTTLQGARGQLAGSHAEPAGLHDSGAAGPGHPRPSARRRDRGQGRGRRDDPGALRAGNRAGLADRRAGKRPGRDR